MREATPILVVCDSLSAIVAITSSLFKNKYCPIIVHNIRNLLQYLMNFKGSFVAFLWVPSLFGIPGNEFVDYLSGSVSESPYPKSVLSLFDNYSETKSLLLQQWKCQIPVHSTLVYNLTFLHSPGISM